MTTNRQFAIAALLIAGTLSACTSTWHRPDGIAGPAEQANFATDESRCRLAGSAQDRGFYAAGPQAFVAASALGYLISTPVAMQRTYENCMQAIGYLPGEP